MAKIDDTTAYHAGKDGSLPQVAQLNLEKRLKEDEAQRRAEAKAAARAARQAAAAEKLAEREAAKERRVAAKAAKSAMEQETHSGRPAAKPRPQHSALEEVVRWQPIVVGLLLVILVGVVGGILLSRTTNSGNSTPSPTSAVSR